MHSDRGDLSKNLNHRLGLTLTKRNKNKTMLDVACCLIKKKKKEKKKVKIPKISFLLKLNITFISFIFYFQI